MNALPWEPAHAEWTPDQANRARFVRWCVLRGRWSDGETPEQLESEGKLTHSMLASTGPIPWSKRFVEIFEAKRLRREPFDPASASSA